MQEVRKKYGVFHLLSWRIPPLATDHRAGLDVTNWIFSLNRAPIR